MKTNKNTVKTTKTANSTKAVKGSKSQFSSANVRFDEFKGHPVMSLSSDFENHYIKPLSFGLQKAKMILALVKEIEKFVKDNDTAE